MPFAEGQDTIQALASKRLDQTLNIWSRCYRAVANPHRSNSVRECLPMSSILVPDQIRRCRVPRNASTICRASHPRTTTAVVDHGSRQETQTGTRMAGSEPHRYQSPRWHPRGCVGMFATSAMAVPGVCVLVDRRLSEFEAKFEQFAVDARGAPSL